MDPLDNRRRFLGALPRPALLRLAGLYSVPRGPGFVPTDALLRGLSECDAFDPVDTLPDLRMDELALVATAFGVAPSVRRGLLVGRLRAALRWRPFADAREFSRALGLSGHKAWRRWHRSHRETTGADLPAYPEQAYKERGWSGWGDFLGTGNKSPQGYTYRPFDAARAFVRRLGLRSASQWAAWCHGQRPDLPLRPDDVPTNPHRTYREEWQGMGDWLGTGTVQTQRRQFLPFAEARRVVRAMHFQRLDEYYAWRRGLRPDLPAASPGLPGHPHTVYRDRWKGAGDFLGTGRVGTAAARALFLPFRQARTFARSLGLRTYAEWQRWAKGALPGKPARPPEIPTNPGKVYAGRGWVNMADWLGARLRKSPRRS